MKFQLKPRLTALVIRVILAMLWPGSSPETAAMNEAGPIEAGRVTAASQDRSRNVQLAAQGTGQVSQTIVGILSCASPAFYFSEFCPWQRALPWRSHAADDALAPAPIPKMPK
jgi:hypothetical protein